MTWTIHGYFASLAVLLWLLGSLAALAGQGRKAAWLVLLGSLVTLLFIIGLWIRLQRPPLRTMGETRLWYSFFLSLCGLLTYRRWNYPWLLAASSLLAGVFALINILRPELHSRALMPALLSPFFIPHVLTYMLAYAWLAAGTAGAVFQLRRLLAGKGRDARLDDFLENTISIGLGFLMLGLITGAVWAKTAWGHYWSWDPKETWALATAAAFLGAVHLRRLPLRGGLELAGLLLPVLGLGLLMFTWLGLNFLPGASGSIHVY
ncbi:MAG: cytochrome c biogenesis protein CcsA [Deltaproteobacteria bacterium]|jgi:ABC-type transport system involved in cytochrome c biogenesis permease subunit|nr:cytochrome c biogenesis protein CcsA [Deltaproteobacteria bacterium]